MSRLSIFHDPAERWLIKSIACTNALGTHTVSEHAPKNTSECRNLETALIWTAFILFVRPLTDYCDSRGLSDKPGGRCIWGSGAVALQTSSSTLWGHPCASLHLWCQQPDIRRAVGIWEVRECHAERPHLCLFYAVQDKSLYHPFDRLLSINLLLMLSKLSDSADIFIIWQTRLSLSTLSLSYKLIQGPRFTLSNSKLNTFSQWEKSFNLQRSNNRILAQQQFSWRLNGHALMPSCWETASQRQGDTISQLSFFNLPPRSGHERNHSSVGREVPFQRFVQAQVLETHDKVIFLPLLICRCKDWNIRIVINTCR